MSFIIYENLNKANLLCGGRFNLDHNTNNTFKLINFDSITKNIADNKFKPSELDMSIFCIITLAYYHKINDKHIFIISVKYNKNLSTIISATRSNINIELIELNLFTYKIEVTSSVQFSFDIQVDIINETFFGYTFYSF